MDAISDRVFVDPSSTKVSHDDTPSLLTVIIDSDALGWYNIKSQTSLKEVTEAIIVALNVHLSLNSSNLVSILASSSNGAKFLFPNPNKQFEVRQSSKKDVSRSVSRDETPLSRNEEENQSSNSPTADPKSNSAGSGTMKNLINTDMYRQFRLVDEAVLEELDTVLKEQNIESGSVRSSLTGALSTALTYSNRVLNSEENLSMKGRILIISCNDDDSIEYIPIMNCIFAAQKMRVPIDVCKLGCDSSFLQQASDATNGIYLFINHPNGLIQHLTTALFIDPSLRQLVVLPTNDNIDFRASCFITGKVVEIGYVCSVCLCILSLIPETNKCPTCDSQFDMNILSKLRRKPVVPAKKKAVLKKRKLDDGSTMSVSASASPS